MPSMVIRFMFHIPGGFLQPEVTEFVAPGQVARVMGFPGRAGLCASVCYHDVEPLHTQTRLRAGVGLALPRRTAKDCGAKPELAGLLRVLLGPHSLQRICLH